MSYYSFLENQWVMNKLTPAQIQNAVVKGYITQAEADAIKAIEKSV